MATFNDTPAIRAQLAMFLADYWPDYPSPAGQRSLGKDGTERMWAVYEQIHGPVNPRNKSCSPCVNNSYNSLASLNRKWNQATHP